MRKNLYISDDAFILKNDDISGESVIKKCFNVVSGLVVAVDLDGTIMFINDRGCEILEYNHHEIIGKNWLVDIAEPVSFKRAGSKKNADLTGFFSEKTIYVILTKSNRKKILETRQVVFKNEREEIAGMFISGEDITRKIVKEKQNDRLLRTAISQAEYAGKVQSRFLASMSHEIRTPLNALVGFSEQLNKTRLNFKQKEYVKIIEKASGNLLKLMDEILEFSKLEAGELFIDEKPFTSLGLIQDIYNSTRFAAEEKKLRYEYRVTKEAAEPVMGDAFRLKQVLLNLVDNAIRFTGKGHVKLRCSLISEAAKVYHLHFEVEDTGSGIPPDKIQVIFNRLNYITDEVLKEFGSTGLGLTLSKKIVELLGGKLQVKSEPGKGSVFSFTVPLKKYQCNDLSELENENLKIGNLNHLKVLLVDDDRVNRLLGKTILANFRCKTDIATNGWEAIEKLRKNKYDVILLDIHMPEISGIDVARFVRKDLKDDETRIVAVTAAVLKNDISLYYKTGINDYLIKPFREKNLYYKLSKNMNQKVVFLNNEEKNKWVMDTVSSLYNLSELKKIAKDDAAFVKKMLLTFISNSASDIKKIETGVSEENWKLVGEIAHKMLPSFRHLEIQHVVSDLLNIKIKTLIDPDYDQVPSLVNHMSGEFNKVVGLLKKEAESL